MKKKVISILVMCSILSVMLCGCQLKDQITELVAGFSDTHDVVRVFNELRSITINKAIEALKGTSEVEKERFWDGDGEYPHWTETSMGISSIKISFPCEVSEIRELMGDAVTISKSYLTVLGHEKRTSDVYNANGEYLCTITVINTTDVEQSFVDCKVIGVKQESSINDLGQGSLLDFPYGLSVGEAITEKELKEKIGEDYSMVKIQDDVEFYYWFENKFEINDEQQLCLIITLSDDYIKAIELIDNSQ